MKKTMALAFYVYNKYSRIWKSYDGRDLGIAVLEYLTHMIPRLNHQLCLMNHKAELKPRQSELACTFKTI